ncbi:MAG: tsf [Chlamydiales bacterium]|jgi:elongation factor Ts|nr:tsf [Chlamydiales bacterium]
MADLNIELIKELRHRTGISMGKCKEALQLAGGDLEKAIVELRKSGMASASKKEGREAKEGAIAFATSDKGFALVEINAETDFVVKSDLFQKFLKEVAEDAARLMPSSLEELTSRPSSQDPSLTIEQYRSILIQTLGENIQIRRLHTVAKKQKQSVGIYSHMSGKIVVLTEIEGSDQEEALAKDISMHAAAQSPDYLEPSQVPESVIANEKDIAASQVKGKPEAMVEKIVQGKLNAFFDSVCLLRQKFVKDDRLTVAELVEQKAKEVGQPLKVAHFTRWVVGS